MSSAEKERLLRSSIIAVTAYVCVFGLTAWLQPFGSEPHPEYEPLIVELSLSESADSQTGNPPVESDSDPIPPEEPVPNEEILDRIEPVPEPPLEIETDPAVAESEPPLQAEAETEPEPQIETVPEPEPEVTDPTPEEVEIVPETAPEPPAEPPEPEIPPEREVVAEMVVPLPGEAVAEASEEGTEPDTADPGDIDESAATADSLIATDVLESPETGTGEVAEAPIDETQGEGSSDLLAESSQPEVGPVARSEFSAGEDASSFARESNQGEGDLAAESNDRGLAFATGTPVTDQVGTAAGNQAEIVYGEERAEAGTASEEEAQRATDTGSFIDPAITAAIRGADGAASSSSDGIVSSGGDGGGIAGEGNDEVDRVAEVESTPDEIELEADGIEDLQRQRRILYRPQFDLPDDILSELAEGLPEIVVPVRILILPTGLVMNVQILRSAGITRLDSLIIEDLRKWKFQPENVERNQTARFPYVISATSG